MYLYLFEDGAMRQSPEAPTAEDLECVDCGILSIVKCRGLDGYYEVRANGEEFRLQDCVTQDNPETGGQFHSTKETP